MMQYLTAAANEVNSWHTLLAVFIVVFALLAIFFFRTVFGADKKEEEAPAPRAAAPVKAPAPVTDDAQLVAVITAAVAAAMAEENGGEAPAFRVVSFRRI